MANLGAFNNRGNKLNGLLLVVMGEYFSSPSEKLKRS